VLALTWNGKKNKNNFKRRNNVGTAIEAEEISKWWGSGERHCTGQRITAETNQSKPERWHSQKKKRVHDSVTEEPAKRKG